MPPSLNRVLLTGASGFVGRVVQKRWDECLPWPRTSDLTDPRGVRECVEKMLRDEPFDAVVHLAAQANPSRSRREPVETWKVNLMGTVHLAEALSEFGWKGRFLFVSSGAVYGQVTGVIDESTRVCPRDPYAASKLAAETALFEWGRRTQQEVIVVRPFNHSGPGQSTDYFLPSMAKQFAALPTEGGTVEVGNLKLHRDFLHVEDVVEAYKALLLQGRAGEVYNLASGLSVTLKSLLSRLATVRGQTVSFRVDPDRYREGDPSPIQVSLKKIYGQTGWIPQRGLNTLLQDLMNEWME